MDTQLAEKVRASKARREAQPQKPGAYTLLCTLSDGLTGPGH